MSRIVRGSCLALLGAASLAAPAGAEPPSSLELEWRAPDGCPQAAAVRARVRELTGTGVERSLFARGVIERRGARFALELVIRDGANVSERVLESDSCADLGGAAAVALSLLMRGSAAPVANGAGGADGAGGAGHRGGASGAAGTERDVGSGARTAASKAGASAADRAGDDGSPDGSPATSSSSGGGLRFGLFAPLATLELGPLPEPSLGAAVGGGVHLGRWSLLALGQLTLAQRFESEDFPGFGATVSRRAAAAGACRGWRDARLEVAPCVLVWLEHLEATGTGVDLVPRTRRIAWVSPAVGAIGHYHALPWLALVVSVSGRVEGSRPGFVVNGLGEVQRVAPAAFLLAAGTEWIF